MATQDIEDIIESEDPKIIAMNRIVRILHERNFENRDDFTKQFNTLQRR